MPYGPAQPVTGALPVAPRYSLLATATIVTEPSDYWINGVDVHSWPIALPSTFDPCAEGSAAGAKVATTTTRRAVFGSYAVYLPYQCSALGWLDTEFKARAEQALAASESWAIENELYLGTRVPANPYFAKNAVATVLNGGTATNLMNSLALLEGAIGDTGRAGMIHTTHEVATGWAGARLIEPDRDGRIQRTIGGGTPVVVGGGYPGSSPIPQGAVTGTQLWAFATSPVQIRRSDLFLMPDTLGEALDRATNTVTYRAERYYNVSWDGTLTAAVKVDRCQAAC